MTLKINIGCGQSPTKGWRNYDNSWSIRLAKKPFLAFILGKSGVLLGPQQKFISFAKKENILWADATKQIPEQSDSVNVVYSSHMIEHIENGPLTYCIIVCEKDIDKLDKKNRDNDMIISKLKESVKDIIGLENDCSVLITYYSLKHGELIQG